MSHPFGDMLRQFCARKQGLTQTRLAHRIGYDQAVLTRMSQGRKDLTGPSGRERVLLIIAALRDEGVLTSQTEANALLKAGGMSPLYDGQPGEVELLQVLKAAPELRTNPHQAAGLPAPLSSFIGRVHEMAEVERLLGATRLLTLTGSGGVGKTRLAIEVGAAARVAPTYSHGVWLVELAALSESALLPDTVAAVFGLRTGTRPALAALKEYLQDRQLLLILDNCEHLIQACAELAGALLAECPQLHILATSRERLNIPGEVSWRVPSLAIDEALLLFAERARATTPGFTLGPANTATVTQICQRLEGMPLALELAAARLPTFPVEQIAARLDDVFRLLTGGSRVALPRQRTLQATIDWSYNLLPEAERDLLRKLSVFTGGWTLEAVEAIHGTGALEWLDQLVNKSLVVVDEAKGSQTTQESPGVRYRLLETIRQYAHVKLVEAGENEPARQRHLEYFAGLAQTAKPNLHGPEQVPWLDRLEVEQDNLRAALEWSSQTKNVSQGERLIDGAWWMWLIRGYCIEGRKWVETVLPAELTGPSAARVTACIASGWLANFMGANSRATADFTEAVSLAHQLGDPRLIIQADLGLGKMAVDEEQAEIMLQEGARLAGEGGWRWEELFALELLSFRAFERGDDGPQATAIASQALAGFREIGDITQVQETLGNLGYRAIKHSDFAQARLAFEESLALSRALKFNITIADSCVHLAIIDLYEGDDRGALRALRESIVIYHTVGNQERVGQCISVAAGIAHARRDPRRAATLLAAADRLWGDIESGRWQEMRWEFDRRLPAVRAALSPADFDSAWAEGQRLTIKEVIALALAI